MYSNLAIEYFGRWMLRVGSNVYLFGICCDGKIKKKKKYTVYKIIRAHQYTWMRRFVPNIYLQFLFLFMSFVIHVFALTIVVEHRVTSFGCACLNCFFFFCFFCINVDSNHSKHMVKGKMNHCTPFMTTLN